MEPVFHVRKLYIGEEEDYGVAVSVNDVLGIATSFDLGMEVVRKDVRAGDRTYHARIPIGLNFSPTIEFYPISGKFLKYVLGHVSDSGVNPPYTHLIEIGRSLKSLTIEAVRIGGRISAERVVGVLVDSCEVSIGSDGLLTASFECRAKSVEAVSPYDDPEISMPGKLPFKFTDMVFSIDEKQYGAVTSASISISNNLEAKPRIGDYVSGFILTGAEYDAEVELLFEDHELLEKALSKQSGDVELKFARSGEDYIKFILEDCLFNWESELTFGDDVLTQTIKLSPRRIRVEVKDDIESYE